MNYSKFSNQLNAETVYCFGHKIQNTDSGILIDRELTNFKTLSEAKQYIKHQLFVDETIKQLSEQQSYNINKVALILRESNLPVTNKLIESYISLASGRTFTIDPVVTQIRQLNESNINGKIQFVLEDNSIIAIDFETQKIINSILESNIDAVEYMKKSSDNFLQILDVIIKEE